MRKRGGGGARTRGWVEKGGIEREELMKKGGVKDEDGWVEKGGGRDCERGSHGGRGRVDEGERGSQFTSP